MAYNASLGEQFEVVQRWLAGGNSTGSSSGQSCPILGVPENGLPRHFRFEHTVGASTQVVRVPLEDGTPLFEEPAMLTQLQWGLYLFTPSMAVLDRLCRQALAAALKPARPAVPWQAWHGRELLAALRQLQAEQGHAAAAAAWKVAIEDPDAVDRLDAAALWAAIREDHGGALHTPYGVLLASRELIAQVLDDGTGLYSICGQRERMQRSFGDIFLGMDDGPRYRDEAGPVNAAIGQLQNPPAGQRSAFDIALQAANDKLTAIVDESKGLAYSGGAPRFEVAFDAREVLDEVLAALCEFWFGMRKQGPHLVAGGTNWHWQDHEPPLYPGHFTALSRYMFQPNPGAMPEELSVRYGQALMRAMTAFVAEHRAAGTVPQSPDKQEAPIAAAIFRHPTQGIDDAWVARTMLGVMMGFIAPIIGAALNVLREWQRTGQFAAVRAQLAGDTGRARAVVLRPMWAAAQMRPMPQIIWRTATAAHRLGGPGAHGVDVAAGQKVVLGLASGTQQSLQEGAEDITPMFGGDRSAAHHPTHACPGRDAGTQALLGTLTALLVAQCGRDERLRCSPVTWGFVAEGPAPAAAKQRHLHPTSLHGAVAAARPPDQPLPAPPPQRKGLVLAVGDSWLHSPYGDGNDLRQQLERWGWTVPGALCNYLTWGKAETLARKLDALRSGFIRMAGEHPDLPLQAVLISAGGNDSTGAAFAKLLDPDDGDPISSPLNAGALGRHLEQLVAWYRLVIDCVRSVLHDDLGLDVPVLLHGYDHSQLPLDAVTLPHWFRIPFENMHYDPVQDRKEELTCMARLIGSFNDRLRDLAASPDYTGGVRWVNLQGTIAAHWNDPADGWRDDLHPHADAFVALAARIDAALTTAYPRLLRVTPSA
jgi:hypothetical protein